MPNSLESFDPFAQQAKSLDDFDPFAQPAPPTQATPAPAPIERPSGLIRRVVGDTAVDLGKGVVGVGEAAAGLGNLVSGGYVGKGLEAIGYDPQTTKKMLEEGYTHERVAANKAVSDAKGFVGTTKALIQNPSALIGTAVESAPLMLGGGAVARGGASLLGRAGSIATPGIRGAAAAIPHTAAGRIGLAAAGEGVVGAGAAAEGIRQQSDDGLLSAKQTGAALASGAGTAALGALGGKVAQKLGIADVDVALAGGAKAAGAAPKNILRRTIEGMASEGVLEELPQSMQEQVWQNVALDKPLMEGVPEAAAAGALAGGLMGGGFSAISRPEAQRSGVEKVAPPADTSPLGLPAPDGTKSYGVIEVGPDGLARKTMPDGVIATPDAPIPQSGSPSLDRVDPSSIAAGMRQQAAVQRANAKTVLGRAAADATDMQADAVAADPFDMSDIGATPNNEAPVDGFARLGGIAQGMGLNPDAIIAAARADMGDDDTLDGLDDRILTTYAQSLAPTVQSAQAQDGFPSEGAGGSQPTPVQAPTVEAQSGQANPVEGGGLAGESPAAAGDDPALASVPAAGTQAQEVSTASNAYPQEGAETRAIAASEQPEYDESEDILDSDITTPSGTPFTIRDAAERAAARHEGGGVFPVDGGFVVRVPSPQASSSGRSEAPQPVPESREQGALAGQAQAAPAPTALPVQEDRAQDAQAVPGRGLAAAQAADSSPSPQATPVDGGGQPVRVTITRGAYRGKTGTLGPVSGSSATVTLNSGTKVSIAPQAIKRDDGQPVTPPKKVSPAVAEKKRIETQLAETQKAISAAGGVQNIKPRSAMTSKELRAAEAEKAKAQAKAAPEREAMRNGVNEAAVRAAYNAAMQAKTGVTDFDYGRGTFGDLIVGALNRDPEVVESARSSLINGSNETGLRVFFQQAGMKMPRTQREQRAAFDAYIGVTPEQRAARDKAKADSKASQAADKAMKSARSGAASVSMHSPDGQSVDGATWVDGLVAEGYSIIVQRGAATYLAKRDGSGYKMPHKAIAAYARLAAKSATEAKPETTTAEQPAATHADPGEAPEAVTPAVIADAAKTADRAPTVSMAEARKVLLAKLDAAIKAAPANGVLDDPPTTAKKRNGRRTWDVDIGRKVEGLSVPAMTIVESHNGTTYSIGRVNTRDVLATENGLLAARLTAARLQQGAEWAANGKNGGWTFTPVAPVENITLDVPGDGTFKVKNTKERLTAFRKQVESFFKLPKQETPKPESLTVSQATRDKIMAEAETVDDAAPEQPAPSQQQADIKPKKSGVAAPSADRGEGKKEAKPDPADTKPNTEDAGEELWANRRNSTGKGLQWSDIEDLNPALKAREAVKSKVWPRPNYEQLVEGGIPAPMARIIKSVYDAIATKPQTSKAPTDEDYQAYIAGVQKVRDAVFTWARAAMEKAPAADNKDVVEFGEKHGLAAKDVAALVGVMLKRGGDGSMLDAVFPYDAQTERSRFRGGTPRTNANNDLAVLLGGRKLTGAMQVIPQDIMAAIRDVQKGWPSPQEAWEKSYTIHEDKVGDRKFRNGQTITITEPSFWIAAKQGRFNLIVADGFKTREDAAAAAKSLYEKKRKKGGDGAKSEAPVDLKDTREGPQRRQSNEDITSDQLKDTFGFKGVNFGNWMKGTSKAKLAERQAHLNNAYDSMLDLAEILNIPPKAIGLNGMLGLAIGAQGHGGRAAAHFIPGVNEINLTRGQGAGSLAHEWAHGLDHYFATLAGGRVATGKTPFLSEHTADKHDGVRPEVQEAFKAIVKAMRGRDMTPEEVAAQERAMLESAKRSLERSLAFMRDGLANGTLKTGAGRSRENVLATFDELATRLRNGDLGEGYLKHGKGFNDSEPQVVAMLAMLYRESLGYKYQEIPALGYNARRVAESGKAKQSNATHIPQVPSNFRREALKLDKGSTGKYWSSTLEMFARSFQSYVLDRLAAQGARNDYLTRPQMDEATLKVAQEMGIGEDGDRYPRGDERNAINRGFDTLVASLRTRETDDGNVALENVEDDLFTPDAAEASAYRAALTKLVADRRTTVLPITVATAPATLRMLGAPALPITIERDVVRKATNGVRHDVPMSVIERLPELLADPAAVFDSKAEAGGLAVVLAAKDGSGRPVMVALHLRASQNRMQVNRIASAYGKDNTPAAFAAWTKQDLLRYVADTKSPDLVRLIGLQLPVSGSPDQGSVSQGSGRTVLSREDVVKRYGGAAPESVEDTAADWLNNIEADESRTGGDFDADRLGLRKAVDGLLGKSGLRVEYLRGYAGLPARLRQGVESRNAMGRKGQTAALYDTKTQRVFVFTHVVRTPERAAWNAAHEIAGHDGLRKLLGKRLDEVLELAAKNPTVAALADEIAVQRKLTPNQRLLAVEEALAELAAAVRTGDYGRIQEKYRIEVPEGIRARIQQVVTNFLRRLKELLQNRTGVVFKDADVRALLENAWQAARTGEAAASNTTVMESTERLDDDDRDPANPVPYLRQVWNDYNGASDTFMSFGDMVEEVQRIVEDSNDDVPGVRELREAADKYFDDVNEDEDKWGGRGDFEDWQEAFERVLVSAISTPESALESVEPSRTGDQGVEFTNGQETLTSRLAQWASAVHLGGGGPRAVAANAEGVGAVTRGADSRAVEQGDASREEIREQSRRLIERARSEGFYWDADSPVLAAILTAPNSGGAEHQVYIVGEGESRLVIRGTDNGYFGPRADISPAQYLARLDDYSSTFPSLQTRLIGVSESPDIPGHAVIWTAQAFVYGKKFASQSDLRDAMAAHGWKEDGYTGVPRYRHEATGTVIEDAHTDNVFYDDNGDIYPFDVVVEAMPATSDSILESVEDDLFEVNTPEAITAADLKIPGQVTVKREGVKDWLNAAGKKLTDLKPAALALVPLNHLADFASKGMTAVQQYIDQHYAMQAYRNGLYRDYDAIAQDWLKYASGTGIKGFLGKAATQAGRDLSDLMHDSTIAGIDPSVENASYKEVEKQRIYNELRARYMAMPEQGQALFNRVRDAYKRQSTMLEEVIEANLKRAMEINKAKAERDYEDRIREIDESGASDDEKARLKANAANLHDDRVKEADQRTNAKTMALRATFESMRVEAPYFPLKRYGNYWVTVLKNGTMQGFSKFQTAEEQDAFVKQMKAQGFDVRTKYEGGDTKTHEMIDPSFIAEIEGILDGAQMPDSVKDDIWQAYLERMPDMSLRKSFIHRQKVQGYHPDALKAFSSTSFHGSYQLARLKYGMEMAETLDIAEKQAARVAPVQGEQLVGELRKRHAFIMNPTGGALAQGLTTAAFVYYLGANPAHLLLNATQTVMLGIPILGTRYGFGRTTNALQKAMRDFAGGKGHMENANLTADERKAFQAFIDSGLIDKTQAHDLAGVGETGVEYNAVRQKVMNKIGWFFHQSERFNREVTAMAAYRLARQDGRSHDTAVAQAMRATYEIHFDYSAAARARIMQGDVAKSLLVFRNYQVNVLYRLFRDIHQSLRGESVQVRREARKQLGAMMGMYGLFAGVAGMPFYGLAMALAGAFEDDDDPETAEQQFVRGTVELLGPDVARVLLKGVPGATFNIDLTERIGMPNLWFRSPDRELEGRDAYYYWMEQLLGAGVGVIKQGYDGASLIFDGLQDANSGHVARGFEKMLPAAARNVFKSVRYGADGVTTLNGEKILDLGTGGLVAQGLGYTPLDLAERYDANRDLKNANAKLERRRRALLDRYFLAVQHGDPTDRAMLDIQAFNAKNPDYAITRQTLGRSAKLRNRNRLLNENGIVMTRRMRRLQERMQEGQTDD